MNKIWILFFTVILCSCTNRSKVDDWRVSINHLKVGAYKQTLEEDRSFDYWYSSMETYCQDEGWTKTKCEEEIKSYMSWYFKHRDDEKASSTDKDEEEKTKLKDLGYE